mgnify:CR=1 FL=1
MKHSELICINDYLKQQGYPAKYQAASLKKSIRQQTFTVKDIADHIDYVRSLVGIKHVGIGTDFDGDGGITGCASASELINFTRQLLLERYSEESIRLIWGGNFLRVMEEVQRK